MKKFFTILSLAVFASCNSTGNGGVNSDAANKSSSDSINKPPVPSQLTDTTLPAMKDSANKMMDTASSKVKMMSDTAMKMRAKM